MIYMPETNAYDTRIVASDFEAAADYIFKMTGAEVVLSDEGELFETDSEGQVSFNLGEISDWKKEYDAHINKY